LIITFIGECLIPLQSSPDYLHDFTFESGGGLVGVLRIHLIRIHFQSLTQQIRNGGGVAFRTKLKFLLDIAALFSRVDAILVV